MHANRPIAVVRSRIVSSLGFILPHYIRLGAVKVAQAAAQTIVESRIIE